MEQNFLTALLYTTSQSFADIHRVLDLPSYCEHFHSTVINDIIDICIR